MRRYRGATLADEFTGDVIVYNNSSDMFSIDGVQPKTGASPAPGGRIRAMLIPKPQAASAAASGVSAAPALRQSITLGGEKK